MSDSTFLAKNLPILIEKAGYSSIERFCVLNVIPKTTVYDIVKQRKDPRLSTLVKIARALGVECCDILNPNGCKVVPPHDK